MKTKTNETQLPRAPKQKSMSCNDVQYIQCILKQFHCYLTTPTCLAEWSMVLTRAPIWPLIPAIPMHAAAVKHIPQQCTIYFMPTCKNSARFDQTNEGLCHAMVSIWHKRIHAEIVHWHERTTQYGKRIFIAILNNAFLPNFSPNGLQEPVLSPYT